MHFQINIFQFFSVIFVSQIFFMQRILLIAALLAVLNIDLYSQKKPYNIVFDITTGDTATHQRLIRWSKGILQEHPDAKIEIVFYGRALDMVVKDKSTVANDVLKLASEKKVTFAVCEQAMKIFNIDKKHLLDGMITVPDSLYELVIKQSEGYGYIKVVN
jgi:intracellular sulfur oxidation DsrE/DsrF family protein